MALCTRCSQPLPPDGRFCVHCGQPAEVSSLPSCSGCHRPLTEGSRFCVHCGQARQPVAPVAPVPPAPLTSPPETSPKPIPVVGAPLTHAPAPAPHAFPWSRLVTAGLMAASLVLGYWKFPHGPAPTPSPTPTATATPTVIKSPLPAGPDLGELADTWSVDPGDPAYQAGQKEANELVLHRRGDEVSGHGPENSPFRFWVQDGRIVGEARDPEGKLHQLRWEWSQPGEKARLSVSGEGEGRTLTLRRGPAPAAKAPPRPLYHAQADLNGDGQPESVEVVVLDGNPTPNSASTKVLKILSADGKLLFQSERFEEPFHTDLDHLAESPEQTSGLHIVAGRPYPRIRLIFATRSGNFVDFHYDGRGYSLAEVGD